MVELEKTLMRWIVAWRSYLLCLARRRPVSKDFCLLTESFMPCALAFGVSALCLPCRRRSFMNCHGCVVRKCLPFQSNRTYALLFLSTFLVVRRRIMRSIYSSTSDLIGHVSERFCLFTAQNIPCVLALRLPALRAT